MKLTQAICWLLKKTANSFHGAQRRRFMAETVEAFGLSQKQAEQQPGWAFAQWHLLSLKCCCEIV